MLCQCIAQLDNKPHMDIVHNNIMRANQWIDHMGAESSRGNYNHG